MEIEFSPSVKDSVLIQKSEDYFTMKCSGTILPQVVIYVNILNFSIAHLFFVTEHEKIWKRYWKRYIWHPEVSQSAK